MGAVQSTPETRRSDAHVIEDDLEPGFPKLAGRMGLFPELAIFRRFSALNMTNLLFMQDELLELEKTLRDLEASNSSQEGEFAVDLAKFRRSEAETDDEDSHFNIFKQIQSKLKEYNEALIQQNIILNVCEPGKFDMAYMQRFLSTRTMNWVLRGDHSELWGALPVPESNENSMNGSMVPAADSGGSSTRDSDPLESNTSISKPRENSAEQNLGRIAPAPDLIALKKRKYDDPFSKWLAEKLIYALKLHRFTKPSVVHGIVIYRDKSVLKFTSWITTIMAPVFCISCMIVLYVIPSMRVKLALIAVVNILGSVFLATFTSAKRVEIFAVLAAFSAVQVVFISSTSKGSNS